MAIVQRCSTAIVIPWIVIPWILICGIFLVRIGWIVNAKHCQLNDCYLCGCGIILIVVIVVSNEPIWYKRICFIKQLFMLPINIALSN